jgi:hypothetical protein
MLCYLAMGCLFGAFMAAILYLSTYFQVVLNADGMHSGIDGLPMIISDNRPMCRLPPEVHQAIFYHLNFKELVRAHAVCRYWRHIILDSSVWPRSIYLDDHTYISDRWLIDGPGKERFESDHQKRRQILQTFSKGSIKSLSVNFLYRWRGTKDASSHEEL